jgi:parallel beta-helix repeat protein
MLAEEEAKKVIGKGVKVSLTIIIGILMLAGSAGAATNVSACTTISSPGTYILTQDIINSSASECIIINASNVVFDGQGYTIDGTDTSGTYGVRVYNSTTTLTNVTVKNLIVTDWGYGIYYNSTQNGSIENNTANSNPYYGIYLYSSSNNILTSNSATGNYRGIYFDSSSNNTLTDNTVNSNSDTGIVIGASSNNTITNNTANSNIWTGIKLSSSSNSNTISNNTANSNQYGIYLRTSSNSNVLTNNIANSNTITGICLDLSSNSNILTGNTANSNQYGIYLDFSSNRNTISNNTANSNNNTGIYLYSSSNNTLTSNTASSNNYSGIYLDTTYRTTTVSEVSYRWTDVNVSTATSASSGDTISDYSNYTLQDDDGYFIYELPFNFIFMERNITNISVNTNGLIELLENGENSYENKDYGTHYDGDHLGNMDAIFASNDDLQTDDQTGNYLGVFNLGDRIVIEWNGSTYSDYNSLDNPIHFQVVLYSDGTIEWNFKTMDWNGYDYDMFTGAYANEESLEFEAGYEIDRQTSFRANLSASSSIIGIVSHRIYDNLVVGNGVGGIYLTSSSYNILTNNTLSGNFRDFYSASSSSNTIITNSFNNTVASFTYSGNIAVNSTSSPGSDPTSYSNIGKYLNITNSTSAWVYLNVSYDNSDIAGLIEGSLRMWEHNGTDWNQISGTNGVNAGENYVYANLSSFSVFAPMGFSTTITNCTTISTPGTYVLTRDIINSTASECIIISASNVVFDGQGHTIDGNDTSSTYGVYVYNSSQTLTNVTVKNLVVTDWYAGIYYRSAQNGSIENNTATSNGRGIRLYSASGNTLTNNTVNGPGQNYGISLESSSSDNTLTDNTANYNARGIWLYSSSNNTLINNTANSNTLDGIWIYSSSNSNTIANNTANSNSGNGIVVRSSSSNTLTDNTANYNARGIFLYFSSNSNTLTNNTLRENALDFYSSSSSSSNTLVTNLFTDTRASFTYSGDIKVNSSSAPASDPTGYSSIGKYLNITNTTAAWVYLNISYDNSDIAGLTEGSLRMWEHNGTDWSQISGTNGVNAGENYVYANLTSFSVFAPMTVDTTPPGINITSPGNTSYNTSTIPLNVSAEETIDTWLYSLNSSSNVTFTPNTTLDGLSNGQHKLVVYANDTAGNWNSTVVYFTVTDTTPPVITITSPGNTTYSTTNINLNVTTDEAANVTYSLNGGANTSLYNLSTQGSTTLTAVEGGNTLTAYAVDAFGNWNSMAVHFTVDTTPPAIAFVAPTPASGSVATVDYVYVNITAGEDLDTALLEWNGTNYTMGGSGTNRHLNRTGLSNGVYTYLVWANDSAGNMNSSESRTVTVSVSVPDTTPPAIAFVSPTPANGSVVTVDYVYVNITAGEDLNTALLEWNGTNYTMGGSGTNWHLNRTGLSNGVYTYLVWANDSAGNMNSSGARMVSVNATEAGITTNTTTTPANTSVVVINTSEVVINVTVTGNATVGVSVQVTPSSGTFGIAAVNSSTSGADAGVKYLNLTNTTGLENVSRIRIEFHYTDAEVSGLDESTLALYYWNGSRWLSTMDYTGQTIPGGPTVFEAGRDTANNYVYAVVDHFSYYALGGGQTSPAAPGTPSTSTGFVAHGISISSIEVPDVVTPGSTITLVVTIASKAYESGALLKILGLPEGWKATPVDIGSLGVGDNQVEMEVEVPGDAEGEFSLTLEAVATDFMGSARRAVSLAVEKVEEIAIEVQETPAPETLPPKKTLPPTAKPMTPMPATPAPLKPEEKGGICGPTLIAGLALIPMLLGRKRR